MASSQQIQPPPVPENWNYTVTQPYSDRLQAAKDAIIAGISKLNAGGRVRDNGDGTALEKTFAFYSTVGNFDAVANQSNFQAIALEFFRIGYFECYNNPQCPGAEIQFIIQRGYAVICGYLAYKDGDLLNSARDYWEIANLYTISGSNPQLASGSLKNFSLIKECMGGLNPTGATFKARVCLNPTLEDPDEYTEYRFSALMAVSTYGQNNTYILAAQESAQFLISARPPGYYRKSINIDQVENGINVRMGDPTGCDTKGGTDYGATFPVDTSITGLLIEGLSYLSSLNMNSTIQEMLLATILDPGSPILDPNYGQWSVPSGVLQTSCRNHSGDPFLLRGLSEASKISSLPSNVVDYIKAFIAAQYNALRAGSQPSHIYGCSWDTPPPSYFDATNQTRSVQLLIDGIFVFNETSAGTGTGSIISSRPESTNVSPSNSQLSRAPKAGVVVGSVVGGIALILMTCLVAFLFRRRKRRELNDVTDRSPNDQGMVASPFIWSPSQATQAKNHTRPVPRSLQPENGIQPEGVESYPSDYPSTPTATDPRESIAPNSIMPSTDGEASIPELVRLLYQRMWQPTGHERPPDYQSQSG
ncbi:glycoside hydrolase family 76 protein [Moniliophthora roreri MCA 2997]|uniref:Glycoside hydrolase family 76 protein n=1 Tax=Moniliophthora roreri (strain MCA 2997) TaxID=1381753 RepID=V2WSB3_MONRO|nr:glycoside hydrolase family 76 protein [Moniliophthora roreri MCA 2997]